MWSFVEWTYRALDTSSAVAFLDVVKGNVMDTFLPVIHNNIMLVFTLVILPYEQMSLAWMLFTCTLRPVQQITLILQLLATFRVGLLCSYSYNSVYCFVGLRGIQQLIWGINKSAPCQGKKLLICIFWNIRCIILNFSPHITQWICILDALCVSCCSKRKSLLKQLGGSDSALRTCSCFCVCLHVCLSVFSPSPELAVSASCSQLLILHIRASRCVTSLPETVVCACCSSCWISTRLCSSLICAFYCLQTPS